MSDKKITPSNNLEARFPELAKEWDYSKNELLPSQVFPGTIKKYWWICKNGHSYFAAPNKRTSSKRGCPYCSGRLVSDKNSLLFLYPKIAEEFCVEKNKNIFLKDLTIKSHKNIWWKCKKGHSWQAIIANRTRGNNCPYCNSQVSKNELRIYSELKHFFNPIGLKRKINNLECDILLNDLNIAIEYDGVYWHKNKVISDKRKNIGLKNAGILLIRVREIGLSKISNNDIIYDHLKDNLFDAIKSILLLIIKKASLSSNKKRELQKYISEGSYINDEEYRELLERLPSPIIEDSLEFKFPKLLKEWNYEKNKGLQPADVSAKSALKVWWKCKKGHEWESTIGNRTQGGNNCPYCAHQIITKENSLAYIRPDLIKEWNIIKNEIGAEEVFAFTPKKFWWKCAKGHEWQASPSNRASYGKGKNTGCPFCSNKKVNQENSLENTNKVLASEWHPSKNGELKPSMVSMGSEKKVWWKCAKGHEWEANISSRNRGRGCPYCSNQRVSLENSFFSKQSNLLKEWNFNKNGKIDPSQITEFSGKKVWWICQYGHEWESTIYNRSKLKSGCPFCSNHKTTKENSLQFNYPEISKEWNYNRNIGFTPKDVAKKSSKIVWWICKEGHEWKAKIGARVVGKYKCPFCKK